MMIETPPLADRLRLVRLLLLIQGIVTAISAAEATVASTAGLAAPWSPLPSLVVAAALFVAASRIGGGLPRWARGIEWTILAVAVVDLGLSVWLVQTPMPPVPVLTRIALPILVLAAGGRR
jgi:hypothetical protein